MALKWFKFKQFLFRKMPFLKDRNSLFYFVLFLVAIGIGFYAYALFTQYFTIPLGGDYTQQYVAFYYNFYDDWWTFLKTGQFVLWDHTTFLGADNITSNTYYGLFSPFMIPILFFPRAWIPQMMAIGMIAKMVLGGCFFRLYLKYMGVSEHTSRLFAIAYAFCGWIAFYLWFNNFFEVATFFPLVLLGIEKILHRDKPYILVVALFLFALSNYFFLITICFYGVGYALFRFCQLRKSHTRKENWIILGWGVGAFAIGLMLGAWVLLPNYLTAMQAPRAEDATYLFRLQEAWTSQDWVEFLRLIFFEWGTDNAGQLASYRVLYPLLSFLYPAISGRYVNLIPTLGFENYCGSIFIFTPGILMFFVSVMNSIRKRKLSHLIPIFFFAIALFVPFFYYFFHVFTVAYSRWQIIVVISMLAYCAINYDERKALPRAFPAISFAMTLTLMLVAYKLVSTLTSEYNQVIAIEEEYWVYVYQIVACIVSGSLMFFYWKKEKLTKLLMGVLAVEAVVMGNMVMGFHGVISYEKSLNGGHANVVTETKIISEITESDDSFYRLQSTRANIGNDNLPAVENYNGTSTFHSLYNYDVIDFVRMSHIFKHDTSWIGGTQEKRYNLDAFLGVKYYVAKEAETTYYRGSVKTVYPMNIPLGYTRIDDASIDDGYRVYQNDNHIAMGFTFDTLYYKQACGNGINNAFHTSGNHSFDVPRNEEAYLKGAILNDADVLEVLSENPHLVDLYAPTLEAPRLSTTKTLYDCDFEFQPSQPDLYLTSGAETFSDPKFVVGDKTELVVTSTTSGAYLTTEPAYFILKYPLKMPSTDYRARIVLIGDEKDELGNVIGDKIVAMDYHGNNEGYYRYFRGFYANEPVKKIIIIPAGDGVVYGFTEVYVETYAHILNKLAALNEYPLTDIEYGTNRFAFNTDFESTRFIVTQVAYGDGWKVKVTDEAGLVTYPKIYNAQGGFVGFVSLSGDAHYEMTYYTPYLSTGIIISFAGFIMFGGAIGLGAYLDLKKKAKVVDSEK